MHGLRSLSRSITMGFLVVGLLPAQEQSKPAPKASAFDSPSRWDIFVGYSYLAPKGTVDVPQTDGSTLPKSYKSMDAGMLASGAYFFSNHVGMQVESGFHDLWTNSSSSNGGAYTLAGGLIARFPAM